MEFRTTVNYKPLPVGTRIDDGMLHIPMQAGMLAPQRVFVRVRATIGQAASAPVSNEFALVVGDAPVGVSLETSVAAMSIPAFCPVAVIDGRAYIFDPANTGHAYAFSGFTTNAVATAEPCYVKTLGILELPPTTLLIPGTRYMADGRGGLTNIATPDHAFTLIIAYALTTHVVRILNLTPIFAF